VDQSIHLSADTPLSLAGKLPQGFVLTREIRVFI